MREKGSNSSLPRVLILIPAFNSGQSLTRALHSLEQDGYPHHTLVVDDGSEESQCAYIPSKADTHFIRLPKNLGIAAALNTGLRYADEHGYEFVARLDADDQSLPGRLARQVNRLDADTDTVVVGTWTEFIDESGRPRYIQAGRDDNRTLKRALRLLSPYSHPSLMFRTRTAIEAGGYPGRFTNLAEDYDFLWQLEPRGRFAIIEEILVRCTLTQSGLSLSRRRAQLQARQTLQRENFDGSPHALLGLMTTAALLTLPVQLVTACKVALTAWTRPSTRH